MKLAMSDPYAETITVGGREQEIRVLLHTDEAHAARPKCLLLHGNPGSMIDWQRMIPGLARFADVAAVDLPGFGRCPRPGYAPGSLSLGRLADYAVAVADALSWREPINVIGHSHGGGVAQTLAASHPDRVARIILVGTLGAPAHRSYRLLALPGASSLARAVGRAFESDRFASFNRRLLRLFMKDVFAPEPVPEEMVEYELAFFGQRPEVLISMVQVALGGPSEQLHGKASQICCPVMFLHGQEDALVPVQCARNIYEQVLASGGSAEFNSIAGAGHMLPRYQAETLVHRIREFLVGSK